MISLDEATHTYTIDGDASYTSVTTIIASWFNTFNADKCIRGMRARPTWPQSKYVNMTDAEIKDAWTSEGVAAAALGTSMHKRIEDYFKLDQPMGTLPEDLQFMQFIADSELIVHESEWRLCHKPLKIVGTIDFASKNEDGTVDLYDWKRSNKMMTSRGFSIQEQLMHIPDSKYWKYTLQLNLYKWLAEKNGYKVRRMYIVCLHPLQLTYQKFQVAQLDIENVLNTRV